MEVVSVVRELHLYLCENSALLGRSNLPVFLGKIGFRILQLGSKHQTLCYFICSPGRAHSELGGYILCPFDTGEYLATGGISTVI